MKWTHCKRGHELSGDNVYTVPSSGSQQCRICKSNTQRAYVERNRDRLAQRKREYNERTDYMRRWHERNRDHEAEYRKGYRLRALELRRPKYAEDYAKPERRARREANRERANAQARARRARNGNADYIRAKEKIGKIEAAIGTLRRGRYSAAEDVVVLRDDLTVIEKSFILQRSPRSVAMRKSYLSDTTRARLERQREQLREYQRNYREANRERLAAMNVDYRKANADKIRKRCAESYARDRDKKIAQVREWRKANPDKVEEYYRRSRDRRRERVA